MTALGEVAGRAPVVGGKRRIGPVRQEESHEGRVAVLRGRVQGREPSALPCVWIRAAVQEQRGGLSSRAAAALCRGVTRNCSLRATTSISAPRSTRSRAVSGRRKNAAR